MTELLPFSRPFHWDLLLRVLEHADTPTLAALGAVSFDLLVATSPLLYTDVTVKSFESLESLFCERDGEEKKISTPSRINPSLSLSSIQNLHVDLSSIPRDADPLPLSLSSSRIDTLPLPLNLLHITFSPNFVPDFSELYSSLLFMVHPLRAGFKASSSQEEEDGPGFHVVSVDGEQSLNVWTRIEDLVFQGIVLLQHEVTESSVAYLPRPSVNQRRTLRVRLCSTPSASWLKDLILYSDTFANESMKERFIVLMMSSESEKEEMEALINQIEDENRRREFVVIVEP